MHLKAHFALKNVSWQEKLFNKGYFLTDQNQGL